MSKIAAIDFETASKRADSAVSVGLVLCEDRIPRREYYSLIRPRQSSDQYVSLHGISVECQKRAPCFAQVWGELRELLGATPTLIAHNAPFDRRILRHMLSWTGIAQPRVRFICTLRIARCAWPGLPCDLRSVASRLHMSGNERPHHALNDARMVADIASAMGLLST